MKKDKLAAEILKSSNPTAQIGEGVAIQFIGPPAASRGQDWDFTLTLTDYANLKYWSSVFIYKADTTKTFPGESAGDTSGVNTVPVSAHVPNTVDPGTWYVKLVSPDKAHEVISMDSAHFEIV
jgi:hypothetical protein